MLFALLGTGLGGALAFFIVLWRKAIIERTLVKAEAQAAMLQTTAQQLQAALQQDNEQIGRLRQEVAEVKAQRDEAQEQLAKSGAPGSLNKLLRKEAGLP